MKLLALITTLILTTAACTTTAKLTRQAQYSLLKDTATANSSLGISIYDVASNTYLYNLNANKYFVPASNIKLFTCYAALKYLQDSLIGLQYIRQGNQYELFPTADPTLLHPKYSHQPVLSFLSSIGANYTFNFKAWQEQAQGTGWAWDDYTSDDATERSALPLYANCVQVTRTATNFISYPSYFVSTQPKLVQAVISNANGNMYSIERSLHSNQLIQVPSTNIFTTQRIPLLTSTGLSTALLADTLQRLAHATPNLLLGTQGRLYSVYSQPTDSVLKPMMHISDNFLAEQCLLMVSHKVLGIMHNDSIINYLKRNDFAGMPQQPRWVDGSGLSRYNMATPLSIVWLLRHMHNSFGMPRLQCILATGGQGTLRNYYKQYAGNIYAKTGTLSNHVALSGYLVTRKQKLLIFSVLSSGHQGSAVPTRKAVQKLLAHYIEQY